MSRPTSGLCEKHDIDPVWDECPCCRVEELEVMLEEERSELSLAHGVISSEMACAESMKPSPGALPDEPRAAYLRGMRHALERLWAAFDPDAWVSVRADNLVALLRLARAAETFRQQHGDPFDAEGVTVKEHAARTALYDALDAFDWSDE